MNPRCAPDRDGPDCLMPKERSALMSRDAVRKLLDQGAEPECLVDPVARKIARAAFLPEGPSEGDGWLSSDDIDAAMRAFRKVLPKGFRFLGVHAGDQCGHGKSLARDVAGTELGGAVFNVDGCASRGSHWVALFVPRRGSAEYFDPTGAPPRGPLASFIKELRKVGVDVSVNLVEHQKEDGQCGVYSLYFLIGRARGEFASVADFNLRTHTDDEMRRYRRKLFRPKCQVRQSVRPRQTRRPLSSSSTRAPGGAAA